MTGPPKPPITKAHELHQGWGCGATTQDGRGGETLGAAGLGRAGPGRTEPSRAGPKLRAPLPPSRAGPRCRSAMFPPPAQRPRSQLSREQPRSRRAPGGPGGGGAVREDEGGGHVGSRGARAVLSAVLRAVPRVPLCGERRLGAAGGQRLLRLRTGLSWLLVLGLRSSRQRRRGAPDREAAP